MVDLTLSFGHIERDEDLINRNYPSVRQQIARRSCSHVVRIIKIDNSIAIEFQSDTRERAFGALLRERRVGRAARDDVIANGSAGVGEFVRADAGEVFPAFEKGFDDGVRIG